MLSEPNPQIIEAFLQRQRCLPLSYDAVGATAGEPPAGFVVDHTRVELGTGEEVFVAARSSLENWQQLNLGWLRPGFAAAPIQEGEVAATLAQLVGLWWLNACRIVYVIDQGPPELKFGFAYGTVTDHVECGEERFLVEMDQDGKVWYDIRAFSRPRHFLARLGNLYVRSVQKRVARESAARMQRLVRQDMGHAC